MPLLIRTDFSDDEAWERVATAANAPVNEGFDEDFQAYVTPIDDPVFRDVSVDQIFANLPEGPVEPVLFVVDRLTITDAEHPIIAVDLQDEPGRRFRVVPGKMWSVENNLSLGNMWFAEFAESVEPDGVFRGFPPYT